MHNLIHAVCFLASQIFSVAKKSPFKLVEPADSESDIADNLPSMADFTPKKSSSALSDPSGAPTEPMGPKLGCKRAIISDAPSHPKGSGDPTTSKPADAGTRGHYFKNNIPTAKPIEVLVEEDDIFLVDPKSNVESSVWLVVK